jgi:hypothetical protein
MHKSELTRLLHKLSADPRGFDELERLEGKPEAWQAWARVRGYDLSLDEARELLLSRQELDDDDLERAAGGWDGTTGGTGGSGTSKPSLCNAVAK